MNYLTYIIVALIPALSLTAVVYVFLKKNTEQLIARGSIEIKQKRQKYFLEPRMEAHQRVILLLDRISPSQLTMRLYNEKSDAITLQKNMLSTIRKEFNHNVAQQLFISIAGWDIVKKSKEETIKIINVAAQQMEEKATATDLSTKIFEILGELDEQPTEIAIKVLKQEFQKLF